MAAVLLSLPIVRLATTPLVASRIGDILNGRQGRASATPKLPSGIAMARRGGRRRAMAQLRTRTTEAIGTSRMAMPARIAVTAWEARLYATLARTTTTALST